MSLSQRNEEYKRFVQEYLLPIIGISYNNNLQDVADNGEAHYHQSNGDFIRQENDIVYFSVQNKDVFYLEHRQPLAYDALALARNIIPAFFSVSKYKMTGATNINYTSEIIYLENIRLAIQKGICDWCAGNNNQFFYKLLQILEQWSVRTYEGKKVTFGFVLNPKASPAFPNDSSGSWFDFLKDDYSATLTDCIHSVIELDSTCTFSRYLSVTEGNHIDEYTLANKLPYRFARVIEKYVVGSCVGVFLLNNGDIILSKNKAVRLIKRNLNWLNMSYDAFANALQAKMSLKKDCLLDDDLLEHIYASTLDVSFSHTGGIIAVITDVTKLTEHKEGELPILSSCDNLRDCRSFQDIEQDMTSLQPREIRKRLLKRKAIVNLIKEHNFTSIDRKLRAELISMDGACILDLEGNMCAIGAIIQNDSGSAGGGRSAAAKKLSSFGMAIKISTDGYIEIFVDEEPVYKIK